MPSFMGMDVGDVRQRAAHLNVQAAQVAQVRAALLAIFDSSNTWIGSDADLARGELAAAIIPALDMVRQFVEETASQMVANADQQEAASST